MYGDEPLELRDKRRVPAELELSLDSVGERAQT
jgi:hypothetical protein